MRTLNWAKSLRRFHQAFVDTSFLAADTVELTYDRRYNIAYIRFQKKLIGVKTIVVSEDFNVDLAPDGSVYGIELMNANEQLGDTLVIVNQETGEQVEVPLPNAS